MAETKKTGGLKEFNYPRGYKAPEDPELDKAIEEGYEEYEERKKRQRRNLIAVSVLIAIIILISAFGYWVF